MLVTLILILAGFLTSNRLTKVWGKDPKQIVIDEYASLLVPLYFTPKNIFLLFITFILFRFFDIVKPPPVRNLEKLPGEWGIMLDDLGAAIYTTIVILIVMIFIKF